ncbi:hypothetical protein ACIGCM_09130 [Pseudomonas sp. NPDC078700]|uniref:hypothetical protein n=1 Tax=Pseudomonas sp. NPDC078700 TaxID=3364424 RepID=UPI0037C53C3D
MRRLAIPLICSALAASCLTSAVQAADYGLDEGYAVLIISRERLQVSTQCEIGLYLQDELTARLDQGQSASFNLPPGVVTVRLATVGNKTCQPGINQLDGQQLTLSAGVISRYRISQTNAGYKLIPAPPIN